MRLTDKVTRQERRDGLLPVAELQAPADGNRVYYDDEVKGFGVRVTAKGARAFILEYRATGRHRRFTIGSFPDWSTAAARGEATRLKREVDGGADPMQAREAKREAPTVAEVAREYIEHHAKPHKRTWQEDQRQLDGYVLPTLGKMNADDVSRRDIVALLDQVYAHGKPGPTGKPIAGRPGAPTQANRVKALLSRMFRHAVERGTLETSPVLMVRAPAKVQTRERVLTHDELRAFWSELDGKPITEGMRLALRLLLLTGQRSSEVRLMAWAELDGDWWTLPGERTKNGILHRVPLTATVLDCLERARELAKGSPWVFPSPVGKGERPMGINAIDHALKRCGFGDFTPHDLRRTVGTELGRLGFNRLVQDKVLNHKDQTVGGIYDRHTYDREKRAALTAWEREVLRIAGEREPRPGNVVSLHGRLT